MPIFKKKGARRSSRVSAKIGKRKASKVGVYKPRMVTAMVAPRG